VQGSVQAPTSLQHDISQSAVNSERIPGGTNGRVHPLQRSPMFAWPSSSARVIAYSLPYDPMN
jgi:hypothetical protein